MQTGPKVFEHNKTWKVIVKKFFLVFIYYLLFLSVTAYLQTTNNIAVMAVIVVQEPYQKLVFFTGSAVFL